MSKRISIRPIEPIILEFADGTEKKAIFNVNCLTLLCEKYGGFEELVKGYEKDISEFASVLLHAAMKSSGEEVTEEEARAIICGGGMPLVLAVFDAFSENFSGFAEDEETKKKVRSMATKLAKYVE